MKNWFTLAEVLITLTIIGVIAALTIPNLMQSYKKHQVENGLKTIFSLTNNAIKMGEAQNGNAGDALQGNLNSDFIQGEWTETYLIPNLKVIKDSKTNGNLYNPKGELACLRTLQSSTPHNSGIYCTWNWRQLQLANGMLLGITTENSNSHVQIFADINGPNKGPNSLGTDVFLFSYFGTGGACINQAHCNTGGKLNAGEGSYESQITWGTPSCSGHGTNCAQVIQRNGWKIPDDYPVKKW